MPIIEANGLSKYYRVFQKKEGLLGALRGLVRREYKEVRAVDDVSFAIEPGEMFGVKGLTRQPVRELSLGERMKMELIAALLHQPQLLLLDEPTIGLDVVAQVTIQKCLREYNAARGVTMLLTSHYMRDVEALCNRVLVITHGKLLHDGPLRSITEQFGQVKLVKLQFAGEADVPAD